MRINWSCRNVASGCRSPRIVKTPSTISIWTWLWEMPGSSTRTRRSVGVSQTSMGGAQACPAGWTRSEPWPRKPSKSRFISCWIAARSPEGSHPGPSHGCRRTPRPSSPPSSPIRDRPVANRQAGSPDLDGDLLRLGLLGLWQRQLQHPIPKDSADLVLLDDCRQRETPLEGPVGPFDPQVIFLLHVLGEAPFTPQGERVVAHLDLDILPGQARQLRLHHDRFRRLVNVHGRRPGGWRDSLLRPRAGKRLLEQMVHPILDGQEIAKRVPFHHGHLRSPLWWREAPRSGPGRTRGRRLTSCPCRGLRTPRPRRRPRPPAHPSLEMLSRLPARPMPAFRGPDCTSHRPDRKRKRLHSSN